MKLTDPKFIYVSAADTAKPGYLHQRMAVYREKVRRETLIARRRTRKASKAKDGT